MARPDKIDLLVFGDTAIDHFYEVENIPKLNNAADVISGRQFYGGMGANTAVVAHALGIRTGLVSVIGTDAEDYRKYMENLGIALYLKGIFGDTTKSLFFKDDGNQISFFYKGVTEKLDELDFKKDLGLDKSDIEKAKCVYMARTYLELQAKVAKSCGNAFLVYNPGYGVFRFSSVPEIFYRILKNTDVLVLNHHELQHLKGAGFKLNFSLGPSVFLITKGDAGCSIYSKEAEINVPIYKTSVVDAAGAGDAFNAGFIAAHIRGFDVYDAVKVGNATASFIVEEWGCQTNLPTWEKVLERYKKI
jgi:sugar/nucleoside kinase (ribokinase family)